MSDASVAEALRSSARLVVVEAPGGCGKTYQGAEFARDAAPVLGGGRLLILTHTNAACDVFAHRTKGIGSSTEIRTIHGLITEIAGAYHKALGLPADVGAWARRNDGYDQLAAQVAVLLARSPFIAASLAHRYPMIICDEHQDASADQHAIIMSLHRAGSRLRIFGDPMQQIYGSHARTAEIAQAEARWVNLKGSACKFEELDYPHRWDSGEPELGRWILDARDALKAGGQIDLTGVLPRGLTVHYADNTAQTALGFSVDRRLSPPIYARSRLPQMLVLTGANDTCTALRAFFGRSIPLWEGHVRDHMAALVVHTRDNAGNPGALARGTVSFLQKVGSGFTLSDQGKILIEEAETGCTGKRRGKPELVQSMARAIVERPDHRGVAAALNRLRELRASQRSFADVHIHHARELAEAIQLAGFDDPDEGFAEIARWRTHTRPILPEKAISTIHKAKGLEFDNVMLMPCDRSSFSSTPAARAKLYVAMSRAKRSLMLVVSRARPSPLFII
ncbi:UvrD-helicase domain-containing protein [Brevundimonas sp.]|uniref:UvrD-helicase domain-containing protein n=1 Tax=Brevundimonas sp. TaxID=1871086 RepID=UPI0035644938